MAQNKFFLIKNYIFFQQENRFFANHNFFVDECGSYKSFVLQKIFFNNKKTQQQQNGDRETRARDDFDRV